MFFEKSVPRTARQAYRMEALASLIVGVYAGSIGPYLMIVARDQLHASVMQIGFMTAAPAVGSMFALFWAHFMEGKSKMPWAVWSWVIGRALFLAMIFCYTPITFTICVVATQILLTIAGPAYASILKDIYPDENRGRIISYCRILMGVVMIATTLAVGPLLKFVSYRYIFALGGLFGVASALVFSRIRLPENGAWREYKKPQTIEFLKSAFAILTEDRKFRWFAMSVFTYGFGNLIITPLCPVFMVDILHIKTWQQSWLTGIFNVVWLLSFLFWGKYVDVKSPLKCAVISVFITGIIPINYFFAGYIGTWWALVPAFLVSGIIGSGIELAYLNGVLQFADEARVSHYQAVFSFLFGVRGTIAPFIGAFMKSGFDSRGWDFRYIFLIGLVIIWIGGVMQLVGVRSRYDKAS